MKETNLVDWTGRQVREGKKGAIPDHPAPILVRLDIDLTRWLSTVQNYGGHFHRMVGKIESMVEQQSKPEKGGGKEWLLVARRFHQLDND